MPIVRAVQNTNATGQSQVDFYNEKGEIVFTQEGGKQPWKYNNPGNVINGTGAIGESEKGFAIFPDLETGLRAKYAVLKSKNYEGETIDGAINKYAPKEVRDKNGNLLHTNDPEEYLKNIKDWTGLDRNKKVADLTAEEYKHLMYAIARQEGAIDKYGNPKAGGQGTRVDHRSPEEQAKNPLPSIKIDPPQKVLDDDAKANEATQE
jgi:hypothetical protein